MTDPLNIRTKCPLPPGSFLDAYAHEEFQRMITDLRRARDDEQPDGVLFWNLKRFARSANEARPLGSHPLAIVVRCWRMIAMNAHTDQPENGIRISDAQGSGRG